MAYSSELVAVNEHGQPIGEDHPRSLYSNRDIELMRQLYEQGVGPSEIARKFDAKKRFVIKVVKYQARVAYADRFVRKEVSTVERLLTLASSLRAQEAAPQRDVSCNLRSAVPMLAAA